MQFLSSLLDQVIKSSPSEGVSSVKLLYTISIVSAKRSILITNAYFIPDRDTIRALEGAVRRGVSVKVIVPGIWTDTPIVRQASRWHYEMLLRRGIEIYEYQKTQLHGKVAVVEVASEVEGVVTSGSAVRSFHDGRPPGCASELRQGRL